MKKIFNKMKNILIDFGVILMTIPKKVSASYSNQNIEFGPSMYGVPVQSKYEIIARFIKFSIIPLMFLVLSIIGLIMFIKNGKEHKYYKIIKLILSVICIIFTCILICFLIVYIKK